MNERIKELAEQAFDKANNGTISDIKIPKEFIEKFAELIVKECAGVGYNASYYECALNVSNKIREHFGVDSLFANGEYTHLAKHIQGHDGANQYKFWRGFTEEQT